MNFIAVNLQLHNNDNHHYLDVSFEHVLCDKISLLEIVNESAWDNI